MTHDTMLAPPGDEVDPADPVGTDGRPPTPPGRAARPRWRRLMALAVVGALTLGVVVWASPVTLVRHVVVSAPRGVSEEAVRMASGITAEDHVPAVDAERVRLAIMTAIPAVADVSVRRSLPDTIRLDVVARTPLAAVAAGKVFYVMDAEGVVFDRVASAKRLPVISAEGEVGSAVARDVLLSLPEDLRARVKEISARTQDDVTLRLRGGAAVRWGSARDAELKARVLAGLMAVRADAYDVSAPLQPTTTGGSLVTEEPAEG